MKQSDNILIAGYTGLVGSAIVRKLREEGYRNLILVNRKSCDLKNYDNVKRIFYTYEPKYVFLCAAQVGGILANSRYPAEFIVNNLIIQTNVIECAAFSDVEKLVFTGSGCIYPRDCQQPIKEEYLLTGPLEKTNEAYAIAKIAGIKMCQAFKQEYGKNFFSVMPCNIYGPNDNFSLEDSHVIPGMMRRFHEAKLRRDESVDVWGSGTAMREFMYVDDLASAMIFLMQNDHDQDVINIGSGEEVTIRKLAEMMAEITGFTGNINFDQTKPEGTPRKLLDSSKIENMEWKYNTTLYNGLIETYLWFKTNMEKGKVRLK